MSRSVVSAFCEREMHFVVFWSVCLFSKSDFFLYFVIIFVESVPLVGFALMLSATYVTDIH